MRCHRCGNRLPPESLYCNRCGSKAQNQSATRPQLPAHLAAPPPRPARRAPTLPSVYEPGSFEDDEEDYPDPYAEDYYDDYQDEEQVIFSINPAFYEVGLTYLWATALSLIVTAVVAYTKIGFPIAIIVSAIFFIAPIVRHIRLKHTVYTLTNVKLEIRSGVLSTSAQSIPLRHIQDVTVSETLKERLIGIGDVLIDSAALDNKMVLNNIKNPRKYADLILDQLQYWN
jgi:membrane protein YdbS with pleckstrin-like domain